MKWDGSGGMLRPEQRQRPPGIGARSPVITLARRSRGATAWCGRFAGQPAEHPRLGGIPAAPFRTAQALAVLYAACAGWDIHQQTVVAGRVTPGPTGQPQKAARTFGTRTADRLALGAWLAEAGGTHVAMAATGVSWKPLANLLEDRVTNLCQVGHRGPPP